MDSLGCTNISDFKFNMLYIIQHVKLKISLLLYIIIIIFTLFIK